MRRFHGITIPPESIAIPPETPGDDRAMYATRLKAEELSADNKQPVIAVYEAEGNRGYQPFQIRKDLVIALADQCNVEPEHLRYIEHDKEGELKGGTAFREYIFRRDPSSNEIYQDGAVSLYTREQFEDLVSSYGEVLHDPKWAHNLQVTPQVGERGEVGNTGSSPSGSTHNQTQQNSNPDIDNDFDPEM